MCQMIVRSFGYGIMMVEAVGPDVSSEEDMKRLLDSMFEGVQESIFRQGDPQRALLLIQVGHAPTKYELSQINPEDWEWMRDVVDEEGTTPFSNRLTMLEECRTGAISLPNDRVQAS